MKQTTNRPLHTIAKEISEDWGAKVNYGAKPYLMAMRSLGSIEENYHYDDGSSIVRYFLANATSWRGDVARRVKLELNNLIK
jgi:hypothetical protein